MLSLSRVVEAPLDELAPRAGFEPAVRSRYLSVTRVTAVHTLGRLPQAADRAILPLRIPYRIGREPGILSWAFATRKHDKIKLS